MNKPRWFAAFHVAQDISEEFRNWMEGIHFPDIEATECFTDTVRRIFQPEAVKPAENDPDGATFDVILYIHEPKSSEEFEHYEKEFRSKLKKEFGEKWGEAFRNGLIKAVSGMGDLQEI